MTRKRNTTASTLAKNVLKNNHEEGIESSTLEMLRKDDDDDDDDDTSWLKDAPNFSQTSSNSGAPLVVDDDKNGAPLKAAAATTTTTTTTDPVPKEESVTDSAIRLSQEECHTHRIRQMAQSTCLDRFQHLNSVHQLCWYKYRSKRAARMSSPKEKKNEYETHQFEYYPCRIAHPDEGKHLHFSKKGASSIDNFVLIQYIGGHVFEGYDKVLKSSLIPFYGILKEDNRKGESSSSSSLVASCVGQQQQQQSHGVNNPCITKDDSNHDEDDDQTTQSTSLNKIFQKVDASSFCTTTTTATAITLTSDNPSWCPILLELLQQRRKRESKMNAMEISAEQLFLSHVLNWTRTKEVQRIEQQQKLQQQQEHEQEAQVKGLGEKEYEGDEKLVDDSLPQSTMKVVNNDEEENDETKLQLSMTPVDQSSKKKQVLKAGSMIAYYQTMSRHGDERFYTESTILSLDASQREYKLVLDTSHLLPKDHKVKLLSYPHRGRQMQNPNPLWMEMNRYSLKSSSIPEVNDEMGNDTNKNATRYAIESQAKEYRQRIQSEYEKSMNMEGAKLGNGHGNEEMIMMDLCKSRKRRHSCI